jgi:hypothetical protein
MRSGLTPCEFKNSITFSARFCDRIWFEVMPCRWPAPTQQNKILVSGYTDNAPIGPALPFQMAEVAVPRQMFPDILSLTARLRAPPASA